MNIRSLTRYRAWADTQTYDVVAKLPHQELVAPRRSAFRSILATLNHTYIVDQIFRAHLEARPHGHRSRTTENLPSLSELRTTVREMNNWWISYATALSDAAQNESVAFKFIDGGEGQMSRQEIILHCMNHASYHRGYVDQMLYDVGVVPLASDYPVFLNKEERLSKK